MCFLFAIAALESATSSPSKATVLAHGSKSSCYGKRNLPQEHRPRPLEKKCPATQYQGQPHRLNTLPVRQAGEEECPLARVRRKRDERQSDYCPKTVDPAPKQTQRVCRYRPQRPARRGSRAALYRRSLSVHHVRHDQEHQTETNDGRDAGCTLTLALCNRAHQACFCMPCFRSTTALSCRTSRLDQNRSVRLKKAAEFWTLRDAQLLLCCRCACIHLPGVPCVQARQGDSPLSRGRSTRAATCCRADSQARRRTCVASTSSRGRAGHETKAVSQCERLERVARLGLRGAATLLKVDPRR